jgi:hypothetical protein
VQANACEAGVMPKLKRSSISVQANACEAGVMPELKPFQVFINTFLLVAGMAFGLPAWAHGGEDHGDAPAPVMAVETAPRAVAESDEFELVAVLNGGKLTLYLDRFATNEPVADAQVEVESGALKVAAAQVAPGVYALPGEDFVSPGKYPLTISVQAGDSADLLATTLDLAKPVAGVEHAHSWIEWVKWGISGALLIAAAGLVVVRRHKKNRNI